MKRLFVVLACLILSSEIAVAQKGKAAGPDYYPLGYSGNTWTGEVTAFDNVQRTLTLTYTSGKKVETFVASIPNAPYDRGRDALNFRVIDFPYDKTAKVQVFQFVGPGGAGTLLPPGDVGTGTQRRNNPPDSNVIQDFSDFKGRRVTVYYTTRERTVGGAKEKYNDVWRIRILPS